MRSILKSVLIGFVLTALTGSPALAQSKIATVSLQKLYNSYWKTKQVDEALEAQRVEMEKSQNEMVENWKKTNTDYQKLRDSAADLAASSDERDKRKKESEDKLKDLKDLEASIRQYQRQAEATLNEKKSRLVKNIVDEIKLGVAGKAKSAGYTLVADADGLLYSDPAVDITDGVLAQLNTGAPLQNNASKPDTSKPDASKPDAKKDSK
jgi:outer membrane protein